MTDIEIEKLAEKVIPDSPYVMQEDTLTKRKYWMQGYKAAQSKGGWTDVELGEGFYAGVDFGKDPEENYDFEDYLRLTKDYKTQQAIYKNYPNLNASKEEMDEMRKLK